VFFLSLVPGIFPKKGVFVGGGLDDNNAEIYNAFIKLSSSSSNPHIGIITAASAADESESNGKIYVEVFQNTYNFHNVEWIPIDLNHPLNAYDPSVVEKLSTLTGVFFGGGDQDRLLQLFFNNKTTPWADTPALAKIRERYEAGVLAIAGSSAGTTIQQATPMVCGGESYEALVNGLHDYRDPDHPDDLSYEKTGGFGFFNWGYLDTHFGTRGRQGRMIRMVWELLKQGNHQESVIFGIDENTALMVEDSVGTVMGETGVFVFDLSKAQQQKNGDFSLNNIKVTYLTEGDQINLENYEVKVAEWKKNIKGNEEHDHTLEESTDIFSSPNNYDPDTDERRNPREFIRITTDLFNSALDDSTNAFTYEEDPEFELSFAKSSDSLGYIGEKNQSTYISYMGLTLNIGSSDKTKLIKSKKFLE
jgi:cyanophycinase